MAAERAATGFISTAISLIVLGFVVEKFELFLRLAALSSAEHPELIKLTHALFYKYLGIAIIVVGILLAVYTYFYYIKWIKHLENKEISPDRGVFFYLSLFISLIGVILIVSMIFL